MGYLLVPAERHRGWQPGAGSVCGGSEGEGRCRLAARRDAADQQRWSAAEPDERAL